MIISTGAVVLVSTEAVLLEIAAVLFVLVLVWYVSHRG